MARSALLVATLILLLPSLAAGSGSACSVPCGRIYPLILIQVDGDATMWNVTHATPVVIDATLTYKFDMMNEGYTVATPNEPIEIRFEYPRLPDWADIKVDPEVIPVDVANPTNVQPDVSTPTNPQAQYVFTVPIQITITLTGQAILKDGYDYHKLLVFAKSTESGLYQSGYGIKELRVLPESPLHEADVAGNKDVFQADALPALDIMAGEATFAGTTVSLTPPSGATWWQPAEFAMDVSPAPANGKMLFAVHDEWGALVAASPLLDATSGHAAMNVTLAKPGKHSATLTLIPDAGTMTPPMTFAVPFDAGALTSEGFAYPKTYAIATSETLPVPLASRDDPLAQFQRDIPFFAFETAQSVAATMTLKSPLPIDIGRGLANLQFSLHDPDGNMLAAGSVDPTKPQWGLRIGSLPIDGWYVLRIKGVGAPFASAFDAYVEVAYASAHQARNRADGVADATGPVLGVGGVNLTLPLDGLSVWAPSDITPALESGAAHSHQITIYDANGTLAYASGLRTGSATFSAPAPGIYRAFVFAQPALGGLPFSPIVRAFTFPIGEGNTTVATTFSIEDGFEAPFAPTDTLLGFHALRVYEGAADATVAAGEIVDVDGNAADATSPGTYYVRAVGRGDPPAGSALQVTLEQTYGSPVTMTGPGSDAAPAAGAFPIPSIALAIALIAVGLAAVGVALYRRG